MDEILPPQRPGPSPAVWEWVRGRLRP